VVYTDADMSETFARLGVAISNLEVVILLGAIIVSKLQNTLTSSPMFTSSEAVWRVIREKVQIELGVGVLDLVDLFHAEELIVFD
jgi:hypothetical protein